MILSYHQDVLLSVAFIVTCCDVIGVVSGAGWSNWTEYRPCSVTCGEGRQTRYRSCEHTNRGNDCKGKYRDTRKCKAEVDCPVDGGWSEWTDWSACSTTCGEGVMEKRRACDNPEPKANGQPCQGPAEESQPCFDMIDCPRDGKWSAWGEWSQCSVTCGSEGVSTRTRMCNNPQPADDGRPCEGSAHRQEPCKADVECAVNGQWSGWSEWSECSVTCGVGEKRRWRRCDQPAPQFGGADCDRTEAAELQVVSCDGETNHCPVDGGWSEWSEWGDCYKANCSATKEPAYRMQQRTCDSPPPKGEGKMCQGIFINASICFKPLNCKVDGGWSNWSAWSCEDHMAIRNRTCNHPAPSNGGRPCKESGELEDVEFHVKGTDSFREVCPHVADEDIPEASGSGMGNDQEEDNDE